MTWNQALLLILLDLVALGSVIAGGVQLFRAEVFYANSWRSAARLLFITVACHALISIVEKGWHAYIESIRQLLF